MREKPLVSVICLCYNQANYVKEAIFSVLNQTYGLVEIIIVDDASSDQSKEIIKQITLENTHIQFIDLKENAGNCKAFNLGFRQSKGKYIIDFAADDIMMPDRIEKQVHEFQGLNNLYGVIYSNAFYIDEVGNVTHSHADKYKFQPSGWVYEYLLERYFICPPTVMIKRDVLEALGGYDENLAYEDFDFWVRSSRDYQYYYSKDALTKKRVLKSGHSNNFSIEKHPIHYSTYTVCSKAFLLNKKPSENIALAKRILTEIKLCLSVRHYDLIDLYATLFEQIKNRPFIVNIQVKICLIASSVLND